MLVVIFRIRVIVFFSFLGQNDSNEKPYKGMVLEIIVGSVYMTAKECNIINNSGYVYSIWST